MGLTRCTVNMRLVPEAVQVVGWALVHNSETCKNSESLNTYLQIPPNEAVKIY